MIMKILLFALHLLSTAWANNPPNIYCDADLCRNAEHVACRYNEFGDACPRRRELCDLTPVKHLILKKMNMYRSTAAKGEINSINRVQASRMIKIKWDEELAFVAGFNVKRCLSAYDDCRNTHRFRDSGQVLHLEVRKNNFNATTAAIDIIEGWFISHKYCTAEVINNYRIPGDRATNYKPFTMMVSDKNTHVGCAAVKTFQGDFALLYMCCNYAYRNIPGEPVFEIGRTANGCIYGVDAEFPSLCVEDTSIHPPRLAGCGEDEHLHMKNSSNKMHNILILLYIVFMTLIFKLHFVI